MGHTRPMPEQQLHTPGQAQPRPGPGADHRAGLAHGAGRNRHLARLAGVLLVTVLVLLGCSDDGVQIQSSDHAASVSGSTGDGTVATADGEVSDDDADSDEGADEGAVAVPARFETGEATTVFDPDVLHTFELTLPPEHLAFLDADPAAEEWVEGALTFDGETIERIGVRYKGSIGAFVGCVADPDFSVPQGEKTCTKLSMKLKFDWIDDDQLFFGLRRLQFHAMNRDPSLLRERLGYEMFRTAGVPAPRVTHARLVVNGEFVGLFALVEELDGRFTADRFGADGEGGDGNLFKEIWPLTGDGVAVGRDAAVDGLRTNAADAEVDAFVTAAENLASDDLVRQAHGVARFGPLPDVLTFLAVDRAIGNDDGPLHWYCGAWELTECSNHNFYWYEDEVSGFFRLIPWDLDNAFENLAGPVNAVTPLADRLGEVSNDCEPFRFGGLNLYQRSAVCDPLTAAWLSDPQAYVDAVAAVLDGPFNEARVDGLIDAWSAQIAEAVAEAAELHDDAFSVDEWRDGITELRRLIGQSRSDLRAVVDAN